MLASGTAALAPRSSRCTSARTSSSGLCGRSSRATTISCRVMSTVHRALAVARVLAPMTRCTVDYSAVGFHPCITEVWPDDVRQITFVCKDGSPEGWSVQGHFERCRFSRSRVVIPGAGVHVCPTLDPARVWVPVQSQARSGAERAAGYAPPVT